jgi:zinc D-Ala-D-Ala carboxypeptidase
VLRLAPSRRLLPALGAAALVVVLAGCTPAASAPTTTDPVEPQTSEPATTSAAPSPSPTPTFDLTAHSVDDPASIWVVVDKQRPLQPKSWVPPDLVTPDVPHTNVPQLRQVASDALVTMIAAAKEDGVGVTSLSAYRPYTVQKSIFERNLASLGEEKTLQLTAKPGYSEHQTGLADDLGDASGACGIAECFATTPAGTWLKANSWRYGWILRYPKGFDDITGITWEPWHFRYVGEELAAEMHRTDVRTLEQMFGLPPSPDY